MSAGAAQAPRPGREAPVTVHRNKPEPGLFANYTQRTSRIGAAGWTALRLAVLALTFGEIALLLAMPQLGLKLFWSLAVPLLPGLFAIAPGLWRQVCPMAFVNQTPRLLGRGGERTLPAALRNNAYLIAVVILVVAVALRAPLFNRDALAMAWLAGGALLVAFLGGLLFKGRSGWCGTFCPIAPVQRSHGQAPLVVVKNGYCPTCVSCQKNCYDFNPRAAIYADLNDNDQRLVAQRQMFMAMLPGLIGGYFLLGGVLAQHGLLLYWAGLATSMLATGGLYMVLRSVFKMSLYRAVSVFAVAALLAYYFFAGPVFVNGVAGLAGLVPPQALVDASRALGVPIVWGVWRASLAGERAYEALSAGDGGVRIDEQRLARGAGGADARVQRIEIVERRSGKRFTAAPGKTLLESMEAAGVPIDYGCRSGLCGADAVCVVEGQEHLNEVGDDESATLARLGLTGRARLACCTRTKGPITVDCDLKNLPPAPKAEAREGAARKLGVIAGVERVVVVGNGAAGITVAEKLRERSDQLDITVLTDEPLHFYNRMALGRVVNGKSALEAMMLLPAAWYAERRIGVRLKAPVQGIDRQERTVVLAGERLPYDRLVLATGATAVLPGEDFAGRANAFVLRNAADAVSLRIAAERVAGARAVVLGGGVLGVEAAEALRACGLQVSLVHRAARLMERQLDAEGAQRLAGYLERRRIAVLTEAKVAGFEGRPLLKTIRLEDGRRIEAELFVACVGVAPNVRLAKEAGLGVRRGIVVDEAMRTSDPAILAVGDAAELVPKAGGAAGPGGLWTVAVQQGRCAAATILGVPAGDAVVAARIVLQLKSDGIDLRSFGDVAAAVPADAEVLSALVEDASNPAWWRLVVRGERIVSAVYVGPPGTSKALMQLLADDADISAHLGALREGHLGLEAAQPA